ncbi:diguanylate cyclase [Saccharopolyspora sp. SCSIO 74807]|uniref:GGDEF domain-containing protein n=1 Tax=Saccharopolyspora sp. SCSIO 74807 TaxID=3118084 RepID=UPI0030CF2E5D
MSSCQDEPEDPLLAGVVPAAERRIWLLLDAGRFEEAEAAFDRIPAAPDEAGYARAVVLVNRALLAARLDRIPRTIQLAAEGWSRLDLESADDASSAHAVGMLGYLLGSVGSHDSAVAMGTSAVRLARRCGDPDTLAHCLLREAGTRLAGLIDDPDATRADFTAVQALCEESLSLASPSQTRRRALTASARVLASLDSLEEAESRATRALELSRRTEDCYTLSFANRVLVEVRKRQGRLHEARAFADRAVDAVQRTREYRLFRRFSWQLATLCRELDDPAGEAAALHRMIGAGRTTVRALHEGLGQALEQRHLSMREQRREEAARKAADRDPLTGLLNRRGLEHRATVLFDRAGGTVVPWLVLIDVDHFKDINDRAGHAAGDRTLQEMSRLLRRECRDQDLVCRWSGDEFVVLAVDSRAAGCPPAGAAAAERIRRRVGEHDWRGVLGDSAAGAEVTVSIGVASAAGALPDLVQAADNALYRAKREGRNRIGTAARSAS